MRRDLRKAFSTALLCFIALGQAHAVDLKFNFAPGTTPPGFAQVSPSDIYSSDRGYGFEPGTKIGDRPFYFSVAVSEGNYRVTVTLGDADGESTTTVKAELRRLMLEHVHTERGQFTTRTFIVNVRNPAISTGGKVRLKSRERTTEKWDWDEKLTLEFNDARPRLRELEISSANDLPTIFILGDSTVCDQPLEPWNSWGQMLPRFFGPGVAIANHAESGESLRSSLAAHRLDKVLSVMKSGDWLFIQYGHNDMKEHGPGVGAFTTYTADLKKFIAGALQHGGNVVLVTPMNRKSFSPDGIITNTLGDYPEAVRQTAAEEHLPLIDLNAMSKTLYEAIGPQNIGKAFQDGTHHNSYGSYELARCIVEGIKQNQLPIVKYLASDAQPFDPAHPDLPDTFHIPASPNHSTVKPDGN
ncbi:MAG TPA: rhamnogalacturonan acetylesterase [Verrucomicrobiae bacterium]|jgi:lysophospholipase L1-like esterase|nr:rhamnogalacturonan acetylesterase [Verrucomicrobiae bacterium]